ncbi:MAG: hypothetical protein M1816_001182 [Peltula sp. TS41687]|nr:MAG: hypothetical protein M1816_001182 [Peltula sp. TS41687]
METWKVELKDPSPTKDFISDGLDGSAITKTLREITRLQGSGIHHEVTLKLDSRFINNPAESPAYKLFGEAFRTFTCFHIRVLKFRFNSFVNEPCGVDELHEFLPREMLEWRMELFSPELPLTQLSAEFDISRVINGKRESIDDMGGPITHRTIMIVHEGSCWLSDEWLGNMLGADIYLRNEDPSEVQYNIKIFSELTAGSGQSRLEGLGNADA